jgi:transmembrane sensor
MTKVVEFPDRSAVAEEAAAWLVRLDGDTPPTDEELQALGEWLHRSPVHREELERLAAMWKRMNVLTELAVPLGNVGRSRSSQGRQPFGRSWTKVMRVGVAAAVLAAATLWLVHGSTTDSYLATNGLYATEIGQQKSAALADGSQIMLNTNSQISVEYNEEFRDVHLVRGEALFTVAKDRSRPFRVYAGNRRIEALGTAFSVYLRGADVSVTVTEGHVSLASVAPPLTKPSQDGTRPEARGVIGTASRARDAEVESLGVLHAGQVAIIRGSGTDFASQSDGARAVIEPVAQAALAERLSWRQGTLIFSGETLEHVVRELSRYTTVSIEIPDPAVRNMRIGGRFPVGETDAMLATLETNFHLRVTRLGNDRVVLSADDAR